MSKGPLTMAKLLLHGPDSLQARHIGWLSQFGDNLRVSFDEAYVEEETRPTLSQLYLGGNDAETKTILRAVDDERLVRIGKLPTFFSNLLPEGSNRERLAEQRGVDQSDELELLAAAGHDLSGGVEIVPVGDVPAEVIQLHVTKNYEPVEPATVAEAMEEGFSIDGVQTKFSMVQEGERYVLRRGKEAGNFICKLPSTKYPDLVLNEGICMDLAAAVGVNTAPAKVRPISELDVPVHVTDAFDEFLLVTRFDRVKLPDGTTTRVHFEELVQAIGLEARRKYYKLDMAMLSLLDILKTSEASGVEDFDEFFRRWTVNSLMGNTDAHSKNWGLIYRDGRNAQLSPAYDLVCVAAYFNDANPQELSVNRAMDVSLRKWGEDQAEALARDAGFLQFNRARRVVRNTQKEAALVWPELLKAAPDRVRLTITQRLEELVPAAG